MLANARALGHVFNPITLYWCSHPTVALSACGGSAQHLRRAPLYLLRPDEQGCAETAKEFYVSPFLAMGGGYQMQVGRPGHNLSVAYRSCASTARTVFIRRAARHPEPGHSPPAGADPATPPVRLPTASPPH